MKKIFLFLAFLTAPVLQAGKKGAHNDSSEDEKVEDLEQKISELNIENTLELKMLPIEYFQNAFPIPNIAPLTIPLPPTLLNRPLISKEDWQNYERRLFKDNSKVSQLIQNEDWLKTEKELFFVETKRFPEKKKKITKESSDNKNRKRIVRGLKNKE